MTRTLSANGAEIPVLGLGTWRLSGDACVRSVHAALDAGIRHIDTAAMYGNETDVGRAIATHPTPREYIFVTTKVWHSEAGDGPLQRSAEASLRRLGLDAIDLLLIHWPSPRIPLKEQIGALCDARRRGLARHIGVSNFPAGHVEAAMACASEPLAANQVEYHPFIDQEGVREACRRYGMALISYCPLAKNRVASEPVIREIAGRHGRTPQQVALRWLVQQPGVAAIPGSSNPGHVNANASVLDFALTPDEMAAIAGLARRGGRILDPTWAPEWDEEALAADARGAP